MNEYYTQNQTSRTGQKQNSKEAVRGFREAGFSSQARKRIDKETQEMKKKALQKRTRRYTTKYQKAHELF